MDGRTDGRTHCPCVIASKKIAKWLFPPTNFDSTKSPNKPECHCQRWSAPPNKIKTNKVVGETESKNKVVNKRANKGTIKLSWCPRDGKNDDRVDPLDCQQYELFTSCLRWAFRLLTLGPRIANDDSSFTAWRYIDKDSLEGPELGPIYTCTMTLGEHQTPSDKLGLKRIF